MKIAKVLKRVETTRIGQKIRTWEIMIDGEKFPWGTAREKIYSKPSEEYSKFTVVYIPVIVTDEVDLGETREKYKESVKVELETSE